jgi:hypothetical protein
MEFATAPGFSGSQWIGFGIALKAAKATWKSRLTCSGRIPGFPEGNRHSFP